jgi:hypothetical protein
MDVVSSLRMMDTDQQFYLSKKRVKGEEQPSHFVTQPSLELAKKQTTQALKL